jgi:glycosyltransferase involved in cell wall biosynthesis
MEAMAHSRPVVAPGEAGMVEVMGDAGTAVGEPTGGAGSALGEVTPARLADALEPYLRDEALAAEVGRRGRERAERLFSVDRTVATLEGLYGELAAAASAPALPTR